MPRDMRPTLAYILALVVGFAWSATPVLAQRSTAADIADGARQFQNTCANCHGPDGGEVAGIDLGRGQFRQYITVTAGNSLFAFALRQ